MPRASQLTGTIIVLALLAAGAPAVAQTQKRPPAAQPAGPQPIQRAIFIGEMDAQFRKMDADKNGRVTLEEMQQFMRGQ